MSVFANRLLGFVISAGLCASAGAQASENPRNAPASAFVTAAAMAERVPVAAVAVEAHVKSRVVSSVTVGAPIEQAVPVLVEAPASAIKAVVAAR